jgi:hypothetical protein
MGSLGAWLALGEILGPLPLAAYAALLAVLALLGAARAVTPSTDWADGYAILRAGAIRAPLRASLLRQLPEAPQGSRFYFTGMPANAGFITGTGPMFRVIYRDTSARGGFLGTWRPRPAGTTAGEDYFFRAQEGPSLRRMGVPPPPAADGVDARDAWIDDQRLLAGTFARAGDVMRAGRALAAVADAYSIEGYALAAAECFHAAGRDSLAARYAASAQRRRPDTAP